jgi:hypothetical protein
MSIKLKKVVLILLNIGLLIFIYVNYLYDFSKKSKVNLALNNQLQEESTYKNIGCLSGDEIKNVRYSFDKNKDNSGLFTLFLRDNKIFESSNVYNNQLYIKILPCGVYLIKEEYKDLGSEREFENKKREIIMVNYSGSVKEIFTIKDLNKSTYDSFDVSPNERFLILYKEGFWSNNDEALVSLYDIKNSFFVRSFGDEYSSDEVKIEGGYFVLRGWSEDNNLVWFSYSWPDGFDGLLRFNLSQRRADYFENKAGFSNIIAFNTNNGWGVSQVGGVDSMFSGDVIESLQKEYKSTGKEVEFYVYNYITGKTHFISSSKKVTHDGYTATWISNLTLEYTTPEGEVKTFTIPE